MLESEKKYRTLFEISPIGISIVDSDRNIIESNKTLEKIVKLSPAGLNNGVYRKRKYINADGREMLAGEFPSSIALSENRFIEGVEIGIVGEDGKIFWTEVSAAPLDSERNLAVVITQDINSRKNSEAQLKESNERFSAFFVNSLDAILVTAPDGTIYSANPSACRMIGRSEKEICSIGRNGVMDTSDSRFAVALKEREVNGRFYGELTMIRKNGERFPVELSTAVYLATDGRLMTSMIIREITARKKAEEELLKSEAEYRSLFENSIMGISQANVTGKFKRINKAYAEMYGYPDVQTMLDEVNDIGNKLYANPDDRKKVLAELNLTGSMGPYEFELNRRNGEKFWALVAAREVKDNEGKRLYLQAEHIDITERKKLENEMQLALLYARNLLEASLDPLLTISPSGKITDVNRATELITGLKRETLIGTEFASYFTDPDKAEAGYRTVFKNGSVRDYPLTILNANGEKRDVLYNASLFKNEAGEVQGVFAAARDITRLKKMELDLRKSKELLEKLNQHLEEVRENERGNIAMNLHDDLGQRLTALNLDIAWLKNRMGVQSQAVRKKLTEMSLMINETIESIREISAFLRPSILYELGLVEAYRWQLKKFEKQSGIRCSFSAEPEEFFIDTTISLIFYRILLESLTNVARHSEATELNVSLSLKNTILTLKIKDNGIGIDEGKVNSFASMGIAGMKERVRSLNGKVLIKGNKLSGTVINVSVPIKKGSGQ